MRRLVILASLLALVGVVVYFDRARPTTDEKKRMTEQLYPRLDPAHVDRIVIEKAGVTLALSRRAAPQQGWWLDDGTRADDAAADAILSTLAYGQVERVLDGSLREKSGVGRIHLSATGGNVPVDLSLGKETAGNGVYALRGNDLLVAEHRLLEVVDVDAAQVRSRAALLDDPTSATTLQLGKIALERQRRGWRMVAPKRALADPERVASLLSVLARARATSVETAPLLPSETNPSPSPSGEVISIDGHIQARVVQKGCGKMPQLIRADGAVLCFDESGLAPLTTNPDLLREPHLSDLTLDDLDAVDIEVAGYSLSLKRANHAWRITKPIDAPADDEIVRQRLGDLLKLRARAFAPPGGKPLGKLRLASGADEIVVALAQSGRDLAALRQGEDLALLLPSNALKLIAPDATQWRSRRVDTFRPDQVTALKADGNTLDPANPAVKKMLDALADLHAESLQRRHVKADHTITVAAGSNHTYTLGLRDPDGCLVGNGEDNVAFTVAPATCEVLFAPFAH